MNTKEIKERLTKIVAYAKKGDDLQKDQSLDNLKSLKYPYMAGVLQSMLQITAMDILALLDDMEK